MVFMRRVLFGRAQTQPASGASVGGVSVLGARRLRVGGLVLVGCVLGFVGLVMLAVVLGLFAGRSALGGHQAQLARGEAARRDWLKSSQAIAQRSRSQVQFSDLSPAQAMGLSERQFGAVVRSAGMVPAVSRVSKAAVLRYVGAHEAVVRGPRGLQYVHSLLALAHPVGGRERPVDLRLRSTRRGFSTVNAAHPVMVSHSLAGGVSLAGSGITVSMVGHDVQGMAMGRSAVFFGNVARDVDAMVAPTADGVEMFATLRSRLSPQELRYRVALPAGALLRKAGAGIEVVRGGRAIGYVSSPSAVDAQGRPVPVSSVLRGDEIVLNVAHRGGSFAYPIFVDPKINMSEEAPGWTFAQGEFHEGHLVEVPGGPFRERGPGGIEAPEKHDYEGREGTPLSAQWTWKDASVKATYISYLYANWPHGSEERPAFFSGDIAAGCGVGGFATTNAGEGSFPVWENREGCLASTDEITITWHSNGDKDPLDTWELFVYPIWISEAVYEPSEDNGPGGSKATPGKVTVSCGKSVNCATGNEFNSHIDMSVGGNPGLQLARSYNSQSAQATPGPFGYGWMASYGAHLVPEKIDCEETPGSLESHVSPESSESYYECSHGVTVYESNGSTVQFEEENGSYIAQPLVQATLRQTESGHYIYTLPGGSSMEFNELGRLLSETTAAGQTTTLTYNESGQLAKAEEPAKRSITFAYNSEGLVKEATGPQGTVKYTYTSKNLTEVSDLEKHVWKYAYNGEHEMTSLTDPLSHATSIEYNGEKRVVAEEDPMKRKRTWKYTSTESGMETTVTNPNGAVTLEHFNGAYQPTSITRASGTSLAATTTYEYNGKNELIAVTDPNKHATKYGYDETANRTSETNADSDTTEWAYDRLHDVVSVTTPNGETTTITRNSSELPETISREAPGKTTQTTKYAYDAKGDLEGLTNPLGRTWKYEYDDYGDRIAETDPEGNKRTWAYNEASQEVSATGPRGNAAAGEAARFTTAVERDAEGRVLARTEPLSEALYSSQFGSAGSGAGQFSVPIGMAIESGGDIWVADSSNNRLEKFSAGGTFIEAVGFGVSDGKEKYEICTSSCQAGIAGKGEGQFDVPKDIAINSSTGNIYVADSSNGRIEELSSSATFIRSFGTSGTGTLSGPDGLTIGSGGSVWVADSNDNRVVEFGEGGAYEAAFGTEGAGEVQFKEPKSIAIAGGNLYVDDFGNNRVEELTTKGVYIRQFGTAAGIGQLKEPARICVDPLNGDLVVADHGNNRIAVYNEEGAFLTKFGSLGKGEGQFENLKGVLVSALGVVYTTDAGNDRAEQWAAPAARVTKYTYDAAGNLETTTDPNGSKTKYVYDADNELTKVEEPNKALTETEYDSMGQVTSQTDGNKHVTKYGRNLLEEVTEVVDPLSHTTTREYDPAGNLTSVTNPAKQTTTYVYDPANRLTEVKYSDGKTPTVKYEYNKDGDRTVMTDGTGTSKYTYDQLDRLTETENGRKEKVQYEYDLANEQVKITYPNEKSVARAYDKDGRLEKVTDWLGNVTKFTYDPDSDLASTVFPSASTDEDKYAYNEADALSEVKMLKGTETLASLLYTRDSDEQVKTTTSKGLPGEERTADEYDANDRLTKGGASAYEYDAANNPTKIASGTYKYNAGDELETGPSLTYTYNEIDERTKTTPSTGPATTDGYDQAGDLISIERPKEGETPKIEDAYAYNGEGLRASQTISGTTSYLAWDMAAELPLILSDGTNSYIYGAGEVPVEQINNSTSTVTYLHHDQAGSTRLLTGSTGTVTGKCTYSAYGTPTCEGTTTTPLGYDAQYTSSDTGLSYLRNRVYDPATAQFLSVDPLVKLTGAPYSYAGDNPLTYFDPTGLAWQACVGGTLNLGAFSLGGDVCYVSTPGGSGVAVTGSVGAGAGFGVNVHAGGGVSNACRPSEYGGVFAHAGGSATGLVGGYGNGFTNAPVPGHGRTVTGVTGGVTAGFGAEVGGGLSETEVFSLGGEGSANASCGC
jgi:RHS repeat-associated protein